VCPGQTEEEGMLEGADLLPFQFDVGLDLVQVKMSPLNGKERSARNSPHGFARMNSTRRAHRSILPAAIRSDVRRSGWIPSRYFLSRVDAVEWRLTPRLKPCRPP
jgi:hypothetical protein